MGVDINNFLNSFNERLLVVITKEEDKKNIFKTTRDDAIKISDIRSGIWPNDTSVKTIGDLFAYVFPTSGGVKNEPPKLYPNTSLITPEYSSYLEDIRSTDVIKVVYKELNKSYLGFRYSMALLKEKGGAQFWFDGFMYYVIELYLKNSDFIGRIKKANLDKYDEIFGLMDAGGNEASHYSSFDLFIEILYSSEISGNRFNNYYGIDRLLTHNLATDELLYLAFIEAGENYSGPYTDEIKNSNKSLLDSLDISEEPKKTIISEPSKEPELVVEPVQITTNSSKFKPTIKGIQDGFQVAAKTDLPDFVIYIGDPEKDWPLVNSGDLPQDGEEFENLDGSYLMDDDYLDEEYQEGSFGGPEESELEFNPFVLELPGTEDNNSDSYMDKGAAGTEQIGPIEPGLPANEAQKSAIVKAIIAAGCKSSGGGACARYSWNIVKNYHRLLKGMAGQTKQEAAGGNANQSAYYNRLSNELKYKLIKSSNSLTKNDLISTITSTKWSIGDVICYWSNSKDIKNYSPGHRAYGHTQVYVGGVSISGWSCDRKDNYGCRFVYSSVDDNDWGFIALRSPDVPTIA
jgi:hypothetical protein